MTYLLSHYRTVQIIAAVSLIALMSLVFVVPATLAQTSGVDPSGNPTTALDSFGGSTGLGKGTLPEVAAKVINAFLAILGIVAVVIIVIAGFKWMTAGGDPEKVEGAKEMIMAGIIGIVIILAAYAIARFVVGSVFDATR